MSRFLISPSTSHIPVLRNVLLSTSELPDIWHLGPETTNSEARTTAVYATSHDSRRRMEQVVIGVRFARPAHLRGGQIATIWLSYNNISDWGQRSGKPVALL